MPIERPVTITLDGDRVSDLSCTPVDMEYLGLGHLVARGLVRSADQLLSVDVVEEPEATEIRVRTREEDTAHESDIQPSRSSDHTVTAAEILTGIRFLEDKTAFFEQTGAAHRSGVLRDGDLIMVHEDIARHNTLDKVLGECLCRRIPTGNLLLCTTGRLFYEIVNKGAAGGFPIIMSRGAPTERAIELAGRMQIVLVGFARGDSFNVYSHPWRIKY